MRRLTPALTGIVLSLLPLLLLLNIPTPTVDASDNTLTFPLMHPDEETLQEWVRAYDTAPRTASASMLRSASLSGSSVDLLPHMVHVPAERSQGACGNCWVWAGTGCMEIALSVQEGIQERLSVQVVNSCRSVLGKYCCQGGWLYQLADFYAVTGRALPWDNVDAHWQDRDGTCTVPCEAIATEPYYDIVHMRMLTVPTLTTQDVATREQAIANIKNVIDSGKGVWFAFFAPREGWQQFHSFWSSQGESTVASLDLMCSGMTNAGGHAVLCVGYNDTDPDNRYWIMLNSWGTAGGNRPNGLFRVNMDMDYNTRCGMQAFFWQTLDISFRQLPPEVATGDASNIGAQAATVHGTLEYDSDTSTNVRFEYSTAPGGPYTGASAWQEGLISGDTFDAGLSGLLSGTRYYYRAEAMNPAGYGYGSESSFTTLPQPPSGLSASEAGSYGVDLEWTRGDGALWTHIRANQGDYPADVEDGDPVYDGTGSSYTCGPLDPGVTHYFRAWSRTSDVDGTPVWSDGVASITAATDEGEALSSLTVDLHAGWNMVSVPLDLIGFDEPSRVFPSSTAIYEWNATNGRYERPTAIRPDHGYMAEVPESNTLLIRGLATEAPSCNLMAGWNLIGSFSATESVSLASLVVAPPGQATLQCEHILWWNGTCYVTPSEMEPGKAYWVASSSQCTVTTETP